MVVIIDNYDSFTYNLVQRIGELDDRVEVKVVRNDATTPAEIASWSPDHLILSPGPCTPTETGITLDAIQLMAGQVPMLGVCLGHQSIAHVFGGSVVRAPRLMHGKTSMIEHDGRGIFEKLPNPFEATRYHSLIVEPDSLPDEFEVTARSADDPQEIMGLRHCSMPIEGVQFHPESFLTRYGSQLLANFLGLR